LRLRRTGCKQPVPPKKEYKIFTKASSKVGPTFGYATSTKTCFIASQNHDHRTS
jgi:hypothetical protein